MLVFAGADYYPAGGWKDFVGEVYSEKEAKKLLLEKCSASDWYQIISQGEADKILNANIRERREIIEDALGLKIYQYKKEESRRKLEKTDENIKQVESLRREIAPHIKFLKKQVEKIEKTIEMRNDLKLLYQEYFKREVDYIKFTKEALAIEKSEPLAHLKKLERELREAKDILDKSESKDIKSSEIIQIEKKLREERATKDALTREIGRIEGEINSLDRLIKKQRENVNTAESKMVSLSSVENMSRSISVELDEANSSTDLPKIKSIFSKIREIIKTFIEKNRSAADMISSSELENDVNSLKKKKLEIDSQLVKHIDEERKLLAQYNQLKDEIEKEKDSNRDAEKAVFRIVAEQNEINTKLATLNNREEKLSIDEANFNQELTEAGVLVGLEAVRYQDFQIFNGGNISLSTEEVASEDRHKQEDRRRNIERIKIRLEDAGVGSGEEVLKEYKEVNERDEFLARELLDLTKSAESLTALIKELDEKLIFEFKAGVDKINVQFQDFFSKMFGGGTAKLNVIREKKRKRSDTDLTIEDGGEMIMDEPEEESEEGIDIEVNLPKKKTKGLMMLSGGERALTSIALLFAMSQVNPPPFIILDETDAALDEANSKKYGDMIAELSKYSQLILVTHNRETMSRAGVIYGVTMGADGISKLLSIQFEEAVQVAK